MAPAAAAHVIWLHGLGDKGESWADVAQVCGRSLPWAKWTFPNAPVQPVSCNRGARTTSWFDLHHIPVKDGKEHEGLSDSIERIHGMIKDLEDRQGVPPGRVVLGGFSQGAMLSLHAGLSYPEPLAGICVLSGWVGAGLSVKHLGAPILVCHGMADETVPFAAGRRGADALQAAGCTQVDFKEYRGVAHSTSPGELADVQRFLARVLPASSPKVTAPPSSVQHCSTVDAGLCRVEFDLGALGKRREDVCLDISAQELLLSSPAVARVRWQLPVDPQQVTAKFLSKRGQLIVTGPVDV